MCSSASKRKVKILLVEDVELIRKVVRAIVVKHLLHPQVGDGGGGEWTVAAVYFSKGGTCDLVLMDRGMLVMRLLSAYDQWGLKHPSLRSNKKQSDHDLFLKAGANEFQSKKRN